jgi:hypothetical protein
MFHDILSQLSNLVRSLLRWYIDKVIESWQGEIRTQRNRRDKWIWIGFSIIFALILLPNLAIKAFSDSFLFGLSFIWSTFLAISFAYILRNLVVLILVYIAAAFGFAEVEQAMKLDGKSILEINDGRPWLSDADIYELMTGDSEITRLLEDKTEY